MKVLISAYLCEPNKGSEPGFGWNWTIGMARLGHQVWCLTRPDKKEEIETELKKHPELSISFHYVYPPAWVEFLHSIEKRFPPFYHIWFYTNYLVWQRKAARIARELDSKIDFDIIHHVTMGSFQLSSAMWKLNKPFVFGPVGGGNFPPKAFRSYFGKAWREEVFRMATSNLLLKFNSNTKKTARNASVVLATNKETAEMARQVGSTRTMLFLDTGLPSSYFPESMPVRQAEPVMRILWVGRIMPRKGLPLVLEALSQVRKDVAFKLTIIGGGYMQHIVNPLISQLGLEGKAEWRGQVPWEEVRKAYLTHDVFMFCSLRDSFGAQFLEAMAHGLPIITLDHQGAGDHIPDDAGIKVPVTSPEETISKLAQAVEYLYDRPELRASLGRKGFAFARVQNWESRARMMSEIYSQAVHGEGMSAPTGPSDQKPTYSQVAGNQ